LGYLTIGGGRAYNTETSKNPTALAIRIATPTLAANIRRVRYRFETACHDGSI
jgi:hypothetical protein